MPVTNPGGTGVDSLGFPYIMVRVDSVGNGIAVCTDSFGKIRNINSAVLRGNGPIPREGEFWIIDRSLGQWAFAAVVRAIPPVVNGAHDDGTALANLLETLAQMGLIDNRTVTNIDSGTYIDTYTDTY